MFFRRPLSSRSSLRARLTFWYLLTLGASLVAFSAFVMVFRARTLYRELDVDLEIRAHQLVSDLRPALVRLDVAAALAEGRRLDALPVVVRAAPDAAVFRSRSAPLLPWAGERQLSMAARGPTRLITVRDRRGESHQVLSVVVPRPGVEPLVLQLFAPTAPIRYVLGQLALAMGVSIVLVLAIATYGSGFTARRALAPVHEIITRVRAIQAHQLNARLDVRAGTREIDQLVSTLNDMLDRIEGSVRSARRFAADASHELQTPIAAMRAAVETCAANAGAPPAYRELAGDLLAEMDRLSALIRDLRLIALAEAGHLLDRREPVPLATLLIESGEIARALAEQKGTRVDVDVDVLSDGIISGSRLHLRRAILNLAQNAVEYAPAGTVVSLSVDVTGAVAAVRVADQGPGIAPEDLPHIFKPFYRADPARARETGGTGLGLAIVDQIVRAHGGRVEVSSTPGRGSMFTLLLPTAPLSTARPLD